MINDERFCELAHKALAREAQPAERAQLLALLAENPALKKEFEEMRAEAAIAREILPLLEDIEHPTGQIPQPPMERLKRQVQKVFEQGGSQKRELRELLAELESWAGGAMRAEGGQVMKLVAALRASVSETQGVRRAPTSSLRSMIMREAPGMVPKVRSDEEQRREAEFEERLRVLEERIDRIGQVSQENIAYMAHEWRDRLGLIERVAQDGIARATHECKQEVRALLNDLKREAGSGSPTDVKT